MRDIKCSDCAEYQNEWCEKVIDSPAPDTLRDCQYYHEKDRDLVKVVRCRDCKHWQPTPLKYDDGFPVYDCPYWPDEFYWADPDGFCSAGERRNK